MFYILKLITSFLAFGLSKIVGDEIFGPATDNEAKKVHF